MNMRQGTLMASEIFEIPDMLARQIDAVGTYWNAGRRLEEDRIRGIVTCARGTSDHAATFFKYLMETHAGLPVASIGPSVASVYGSKLRLEGFACVSFSQSGTSPDLARLQGAAKAGGARTIAILNAADSPLGEGADMVLPVLAGPERAVAATKSFVGMLFASLAILAGYRQDRDMKAALEELPGLALQALDLDWSSAAIPLARSGSLYCVSRGPGLAVAAEAALKFKETCRLHAEAFSAAELFHGPVAIVRERFAVLFFGARGSAESSLDEAMKVLRNRGACVLLAHPDRERASLAMPCSRHEAFDPLVQSVGFYRFVERLARDLGEDPDAPPGLKKVTKTV